MITVFTPVYNRADIIENLYSSLLNQTDFDFEWLIIDDGSTDAIMDVVCGWVEAKATPFPVRFYRQENGGKHRAINRGVRLAQGEAFFIVDSDDSLTEDAIALIRRWWKDVENDDGYAGVAGLRGNRNGDVIGDVPLFEAHIDATNIERADYGLLGDKAEVYKTSVLKENPFPEFEGENFLTEAAVWDKLAYQSLKIRWFNRVIYVCEYRPDGLTSQGWNAFVKNPIGWGFYIQQKCRFYHLNEAEKTGLYLEYYIFMKDRLPDHEIWENLGIDEETYKRVKESHRNCIEKTMQTIGNKLAVYGAGMRGKKVLKLYQGTEIGVCFVLDTKQVDVPFRQIGLYDHYPTVDAIIVTPAVDQDAIMDFLRKQTTGKVIGYEAWKVAMGFGERF